MSKEHYTKLENSIRISIERNKYDIAALLQMFREEGLTDERFRWALLHSSAIYRRCDFLNKELYPYLNDGHIDTALRKIVKTLAK